MGLQFGRKPGLNEFTKDTKMSSLCCMVSAVDFYLNGENKERTNRKLELYRDALESKGFITSWKKTEYMACNCWKFDLAEVNN